MSLSQALNQFAQNLGRYLESPPVAGFLRFKGLISNIQKLY